MKNIKAIFFLPVLVLILISGCKKETTADVSKAVKVSYPEITLNGNALVILATGTPYTDAGAKLKDDITGAITTIQPTDNPVNTTQPGLYVVTFSAKNANGFETTASRLVAVTGVTGTTDRTGTYLRTATGINCYITRLAEGVYELKNPGGAGVSVDTKLIMVETALNVYSCPAQPTTDFGYMSVVNINFNATGVTWNVINPGFGTGTRTFVKQ
jgi:Domain of unknown function (DUF5011)